MYQNIFVTSKSDHEESMIYLWDDEKGLIVSPFKEFNYAYKRHPKGEFVSIYGDRLKRVDRFRWEDPDLFESDLPRETRVLTDLYLESDEPSKNHRILCIDIEVESKNGFTKPEDATNEITAISNYDYSKDQYVVYLLDPEGKMPTHQNDNETIFSCKTEYDLIKMWLEYYTALNPTIVTGWNVDMYDIPYLYNRLKRIGGYPMATKLSPVGIIRFNDNQQRYVIAGVSVLDYIVLYKKFTYSQKPSYRLDAIAKDEIGEGKVEYEGTLDQLYNKDIKTFLKYTLNDVKLVVGIDRKMKLIELARFICHLGHVPYEAFSASSRFIEGTIITYLHRKNIIVPNKPLGGNEKYLEQKSNDEEGFAGAYVKSPFPGLFEWVYSLDLESLYPSLIMSLNISPDTKFGRVYNWDVEKYIQNDPMQFQIQIGVNQPAMLSRAELTKFLRENSLSISSNGILYKAVEDRVVGKIISNE